MKDDTSRQDINILASLCSWADWFKSNMIWNPEDKIFASRSILFGPWREKTCLQGFRQSETQTSLFSYWDQLENWNFTCSKLRYGTFQKVNNKALIRLSWRQVFSLRRPFHIAHVHTVSYWLVWALLGLKPLDKSFASRPIWFGSQREKTCLRCVR